MKTPLILALAFCSFTLARAELKEYLVFEGSESPDGKYAIAWGKADHTPIDTSDPDAVVDAEDFAWYNYVVNLEAGEIVSAIDTGYFEIGNRSRNHHSLTVVWKEDSSAALVVEGAKWDVFAVILLRRIQTGKETTLELVNLTQPLTNLVRTRFLKSHPQHAADIQRWAIDLFNFSWLPEGNRVQAEVSASVPKMEDTFSYDGKVTFQLPPANWISIVEK